jgi:hypothetical protein
MRLAARTVVRHLSARLRIRSFERANALQAVLILVAVVQFLRCDGAAYIWEAVGLGLPLLRCCFRAEYRRRVMSRLRGEWASIEAFADVRDRLPWRATVLLIVLPAGLFFLSQGRPITSGDSKPIALTASTLVCHGTTDLSAFAPVYAPVFHVAPLMDMPYFCMRTTTGVHSSYPSGMVIFALPSAALARILGVDLFKGSVQDHLEKGVASWLAAACLGLFFLLALHLADARTAALMTLLLATGSGLCSTVGQALWQHDGVLFWMLLALLIEFRTWRNPRLLPALLQGVALAMMFACRLTSAPLIAAFGLWMLMRAPRRAVWVGLVSLLSYLPWAWYYQSIYGNPLGPSVGQMGLFIGHWRETLLPLLISPDHGLLVYQPWILLALTLMIPSARRCLTTAPADVPRGWAWFCAAAIVPYFALVASWYCWWGGHCWGSRLLVEIVPFVALLCLYPVAVLRRLRWGRRLLAATVFVAALVHLTGVYLKVDFRDTQPGLIGTRHEPPGSWTHWPFLTPFVGSLHSYR